MSKSWKDALLRSGVPLEADVKRYLDQRGCITKFESSYLRPDENKIERQFSYDIDASYIRAHHFISFLVECKYRYQGVQWVFLPSNYGGPDEFDANQFMHPIDHFVSLKFPYGGAFPRRLSPSCSKGIEITNDGPNEKSISQALSQIAFAFAPKVADAWEHQVLGLLGRQDVIFYHVPLIVTTATLFRLNADVSIDAIRGASSIEDIATKHQCLVQSYNAGVELQTYSRRVLEDLRGRLGNELLRTSIQSFTKDIDHLLSVIVSHHCPAAFVIVSVAEGWAGLDHVFAYIDELIAPSSSLRAELAVQDKESAARQKALKKLLKRPRRRRKKGDGTC